MAYDGIVLKSIRDELESTAVGAKIDKITQPEKDEIHLFLRTKTDRKILLLSASGNHAGVRFTPEKKPSPLQPPLFTMVLRKHLGGSLITGIRQMKMDRILHIDTKGRNELGDPTELTLTIEIMGRHSNIILHRTEDGEIIDAIVHVNRTMSSLREILPGKIYDPTLLGDKKNPLLLSKDELFNDLDSAPGGEDGFAFLLSTYTGISPVMAREILYRSAIEEKRPLSSWTDEMNEDFVKAAFGLFQDVVKKNYTYSSYGDDKVVEFSVLPLLQYKSLSRTLYSSASEMLDTVYREKDRRERMAQRAQALRKSIKTHLDRGKNKRKKLFREWEEAKDRDKYRIYGDLLSANAHRIPRGETEVELENFYAPGEKILVPLDPRYNGIDNASLYYKKYTKLKTGAKKIEGQLEETQEDISYLENTLNYVDQAETPEDIDALKEEYQRDYRKKSSPSKKRPSKMSRPLSFLTPDGGEILVGKNNRQNEEITFKTARKEDLWFHVKDHPGSHVILRKTKDQFSNDDMLLAASLAAYYSTLRHQRHVDVDYTLRKYVTRHPSGRPGLVHYRNFKTVHTSGKRPALPEEAK